MSWNEIIETPYFLILIVGLVLSFTNWYRTQRTIIQVVKRDSKRISKFWTGHSACEEMLSYYNEDEITIKSQKDIFMDKFTSFNNTLSITTVTNNSSAVFMIANILILTGDAIAFNKSKVYRIYSSISKGFKVLGTIFLILLVFGILIKKSVLINWSMIILSTSLIFDFISLYFENENRNRVARFLNSKKVILDVKELEDYLLLINVFSINRALKTFGTLETIYNIVYSLISTLFIRLSLKHKET